MEIAEFLLARIAEEREESFWLHGERCDTKSAAAIGGFPCDCPWPARIEAECESLRQIVERARELIRQAEATAPYYPESESASAVTAEEFLRLLSLPYVDHADYQQEWRP